MITDEGGDRKLHFFVAAALIAVAFAVAAGAGVLETVQPYLLGVSVLVVALFVLGRW